MQNIKGAIFDMDGTLLDSMPVWKRLTQNYLKQFDLHITDQDFAACEGFSQPQVADYFLTRHPAWTSSSPRAMRPSQSQSRA